MEIIKTKWQQLMNWLTLKLARIWFIGPVTIYGAGAMNWMVRIKCKPVGFICFSLPVLSRIKKTTTLYPNGIFGYRLDWFFFFSANGNQSASTFYRGSDKHEVIRAQIRRLILGHGFNASQAYKELAVLNGKYSRFVLYPQDYESAIRMKIIQR